MVRRLLKYYLLGKPLKELEMNRILEKKSKSKELTSKEEKFENLYNYTNDDKDYMLLSKYMVYQRVRSLINKKKRVICDLHDRDGKIGLQILDISDNIYDDVSYLSLKGGEIHTLTDDFLYNLIFDIKKSHYSLQGHDQYFEKIEINNDY